MRPPLSTQHTLQSQNKTFSKLLVIEIRLFNFYRLLRVIFKIVVPTEKITRSKVKMYTLLLHLIFWGLEKERFKTVD